MPVDLSSVEGSGGVVWSVSPGGVHTNLVVFEPGASIGRHRNDALDVLVVVLAGHGTASVDDAPVELSPNVALLLPRRANRSVRAGAGGLRYLTIHGRRPPLGPARLEQS